MFEPPRSPARHLGQVAGGIVWRRHLIEQLKNHGVPELQGPAVRGRHVVRVIVVLQIAGEVDPRVDQTCSSEARAEREPNPKKPQRPGGRSRRFGVPSRPQDHQNIRVPSRLLQMRPGELHQNCRPMAGGGGGGGGRTTCTTHPHPCETPSAEGT